MHLWDLLINNEKISPLLPDSPLMAPLDLDDELKLSYSDSRSFTILYGIVDPASADATNYQVMMVGIDKDWRDVGNQRSFTAMDLAFGTYRLRIRAASVAGNWDAAPVRELVIKIAPPVLSISMGIYRLFAIAYIGCRNHLAFHENKNERKRCHKDIADGKGKE